MTILFLVLCFILLTPAASAKEIKPLYQLPEKSTASEKTAESDAFLVGSDTGLFKISKTNNAVPLWTEARVDQIVPVKLTNENSEIVNGWMIRTAKGLFFTSDLHTFVEKDNGLSFLTIKKYDGTSTTFEKQIQSLKDFAVNPSDNNEMVTSTKDAVYYSKDGGNTWKSIKAPTETAGNKAVAVCTINGETVVFMSHPITGFYYIQPNGRNVWIASKGFELMPSLKDADEISDILPVVTKNEDGTEKVDVYISQTYLPRIYKYNWETKTPKLIYKGTDPVNVIDGLSFVDGNLMYTTLEGFGGLNLQTFESAGTPAKKDDWEKIFSLIPGMINAAYIPKAQSGFNQAVTLGELWMLYPGTINTPYAEKADGKKSIYASAYQCRNQAGIDKYKNLCKTRNMNSIVIDMKDDSGFLRYKTENPMLKEVSDKLKATLGYGTVSSYAIDIDHFVEEFKKDDIYLVARIVAFKDKCLSFYDNGKYAVKDKNGGNWRGVKTDGTKYDEFWCDPYCEKLWEYDVTIAKELIARGFDEIQFDYIRFPTDGVNLGSARYSWKSEGMDKESALISFLKYARENIDAPIGIDIYGANGWYRSGARTGQESEMLAEYVDVIGPMFYPSHFEQSFLNYEPYADRTYRIYYYGTFRNTVLVRNRAIIRPWVQCFYLNVSYDKNYYDYVDKQGRYSYITKELFGVRDSVNRGYMCWNNSGNYDRTPKDVTNTEPFTGLAPEASFTGRVPALGTRARVLSPKSVDVSDIKNSKTQGTYEPKYMEKTYTPFLRVAGVK